MVLAALYALHFLIAPASAVGDVDVAPQGLHALGFGTENRQVIYKAITELDIDNNLVLEGTTQKPTGTFTFEARRARFNPIIELRANFDDHATASVELVR